MESGKERVITVAAMRAADSRTIKSGTPSKELMRRAAQGIFDAYDGWTGKRTLAVCDRVNCLRREFAFCVLRFAARVSGGDLSSAG